MLSRPTRARTPSRRLIAGGVAGVAAALAFAAEMEVDRRVFRRNTDDLVLLGRLVSAERNPARAAGLGLHVFNGAIAGSLYGMAFHEWLPGSPAARGTIFANIENVSLYPLGLLERHHPAIREGQIAGYWNFTAFIQETIRHVMFGVVLGEATERILRASR
jgi:hypothetical protein